MQIRLDVCVERSRQMLRCWQQVDILKRASDTVANEQKPWGGWRYYNPLIATTTTEKQHKELPLVCVSTVVSETHDLEDSLAGPKKTHLIVGFVNELHFGWRENLYGKSIWKPSFSQVFAPDSPGFCPNLADSGSTSQSALCREGSSAQRYLGKPPMRNGGFSQWGYPKSWMVYNP